MTVYDVDEIDNKTHRNIKKIIWQNLDTYCYKNIYVQMMSESDEEKGNVSSYPINFIFRRSLDIVCMVFATMSFTDKWQSSNHVLFFICKTLLVDTIALYNYAVEKIRRNPPWKNLMMRWSLVQVQWDFLKSLAPSDNELRKL